MWPLGKFRSATSSLRIVALRRSNGRCAGAFALEGPLVLQLNGPVAPHVKVVGEAISGLQLQTLVLALWHAAVLPHDVIEGSERDAVAAHGGLAVLDRDEVFDQIGCVAPDVGETCMGVGRELSPKAKREFSGQRRRQVVRERYVVSRERAAHEDRVVGRGEPGRKIQPLSGRTGIRRRVAIGVADVRVASELDVTVLAGIVSVGGMDGRPAVSNGVVAGTKARHDGIDADAVRHRRGVAGHVFVADSQVQ